MKIKGYLFTGIAKQENHTYYSLGDNRNSRFYYNFIDYLNDNERFRFTPFVYEVELDSEDVFLLLLKSNKIQSNKIGWF